MNKKLVFLVILSLTIAMIGSALAQTSPKPEALPSVDDIIKKYTDATGSKAARDKITSRVGKGTIELPAQGLSGTVELFGKFPDKSLSVVNINGLGEIRNAYNGKVAWSNDPFSGLREKTGRELAAAKRESDFDSVTNWKKYFTKAEVAASEKVGDANAYVIKFTDADGKVSSKFFDKKTFYVIREDEIADSPQGTFPVSSINSDFRTVDGITLPFEVKQDGAGATFVIKITEIKHNVAIEDSKFEKPAN